MRSIGVDPGSNTFDIFGLDGPSRIIMDEIIPTHEILSTPDRLISILESVMPFDILIAPSGFGIPLKHAREIDDRDIFKMVLKRPGEGSSLGLQHVIERIISKGWNAYFIPGVKNFTSVPEYRKINILDMGTADKVCCCIACMWSLYKRGESYQSMNFIMLELGSWFSAAVAVLNGKIVNGVGGSNLPGFGSIGNLDSELAYLMQPFGKKAFYKSGINCLLKTEYPEKSHFDFSMLSNPLIKNHIEYLLERIEKELIGLKRICGYNKHEKLALYVSGRYSKDTDMMAKLNELLTDEFVINRLEIYPSKASNAAKGAALIGLGLLGGITKELIDHIELKKATADIFSNLDVELKF